MRGTHKESENEKNNGKEKGKRYNKRKHNNNTAPGWLGTAEDRGFRRPIPAQTKLKKQTTKIKVN